MRSTPGSDAWAKAGQIKKMQDALLTHQGSWNVVSATRGANDAEFAEQLAEFYAGYRVKYGNFQGRPWAIQDADVCPDTDDVYTTALSRKDHIDRGARRDLPNRQAAVARGTDP